MAGISLGAPREDAAVVIWFFVNHPMLTREAFSCTARVIQAAVADALKPGWTAICCCTANTSSAADVDPAGVDPDVARCPDPAGPAVVAVLPTSPAGVIGLLKVRCARAGAAAALQALADCRFRAGARLGLCFVFPNGNPDRNNGTVM